MTCNDTPAELHRAVDAHLWGLAVYSGCPMDCGVQLVDVLYKLSSGACVRVEKLNKSFFLILGELTYYWLDNKGNYYSEDTFSELCRTYSFEIVDPGHRVYSC